MSGPVRLIAHGVDSSLLRPTLTNSVGDRDLDPSDLWRKLAAIIGKQATLWLARNREGGLTRSLEPLQRLRTMYDEAGSPRGAA